MKNSWRYGFVNLSKNKTFEYQFEGPGFSNSWFELETKWTKKCDHAGLWFSFSLFNLFWMNFNISDNRHWDYDNDCWKVYKS